MDSWLNALVAMLDSAASRWLGAASWPLRIGGIALFVLAVVLIERSCSG